MRKFFGLVLLAVACGGPSAKAKAPSVGTDVTQAATGDTSAKIRWAMAGSHRSEKNRARDAFRHPFETLSFFGLRDDMTVVELWPGGGWYTEILAPVLRDRGKLRVTNFTKESDLAQMAKDYEAKLAGAPAIYGKVEVMPVLPPNQLSLGPDESADLVLTFRNLHNWIMGSFEAKVFETVFKVLKHGGVFGFVEHRAKEGTDPKLAKDTGYVPEAYAISLAQAAGFKLDSKSDINANPKDPKDHQGGVWALPPNLTNGEKDQAKYLSMGESDRMTLKFVKP
jgi:predicted methyltransferase